MVGTPADTFILRDDSTHNASHHGTSAVQPATLLSAKVCNSVRCKRVHSRPAVLHGVACAQPCTWRALRGPDRHKGAVDPSVFVQHLGGRLGGVFGGAQGWRQEVQGDHAAARKHVHRKHRRGAPCVRLPASAHAPPPSPHEASSGPSRVQVLLPGQGVCVVRFHNPTGWFYSSQVKVRYSLSAGPTLSAPPDAARSKKPPPPPPPLAAAVAALPTAAEAPSAAEEPAAATPTPKVLSPEMGAALSRQLARRPSLDEVTSSSSPTPTPSL